MVDKLTPERRSENMRRIRSKNTKAEHKVRIAVRQLGFAGYRLHRSDIPGKPDLAWIGRKIALFVHGCFWHGHSCKEGQRVPKSNVDYWVQKISRNRNRDHAHLTALTNAGWRVGVVWECELKTPALLEKTITELFAGCVDPPVKKS